MKTAWGDCLDMAKEYHRRHGLTGDAAGAAAYKDVMDYLESVKTTFTAAELETWAEKSGAFIAEGYSREEADAAAADLVLSTRLLSDRPETTRDTIEGATLNAKTEKVQKPAAPQTNALQPQETRPIREGREALEYITGQGIPIKGFMAATPDGDRGSYSTERKAWNEKYRYKAFIAEAFLVLDIDNINSFYVWLAKEGITRAALPRTLKNIENFPCYVKSPSPGSYHLYFKYTGATPKAGTSYKIFPDVEVKTQQITAPGSYRAADAERPDKPAGSYTLYGELAAAPDLSGAAYRFLFDRLTTAPRYVDKPAAAKPASRKPQRAAADRPYPSGAKKKYTAEEVFNYAAADNGGLVKHDLVFAIAKRTASKNDNEATADDIIRLCKEYPDTREHNQIDTTVNSVFRSHGRA